MTQTQLDSTQYKPAGAPTQVQFNGGGAMSGSANLTFDGTTLSVSQLDVTSIAAGLGLPVMTTVQKNAIVSPATGSLVYDSTLGFVQEWNGTAWIYVSPLYTAGTGLTLTSNQFSLTTPVTVAHGGTGTATPGLIAGSNITITGSWPDQTINASASVPGGADGDIQYNSGGAFAGAANMTTDGTNLSFTAGGSITSTTPLSAGSQSGGSIVLTTGINEGTGPTSGGGVVLTTGAVESGGTNGNITGGSITLSTGLFVNGGGAPVVQGGSINLTTGQSQGSGGSETVIGGSINLSTGPLYNAGTLTGGSINLSTGTYPNTSGANATTGGSITLSSGSSNGGTDKGGNISLTSFTPANGGSIVLTGTGANGTPSVPAHGNIYANYGNFSNLVLTTPLPLTSGGTGTATPALVAGTNVTITGTFPNQTINASSATPAGATGDLQYNNAGAFGGATITTDGTNLSSIGGVTLSTTTPGTNGSATAGNILGTTGNVLFAGSYSGTHALTGTSITLSTGSSTGSWSSIVGGSTYAFNGGGLTLTTGDSSSNTSSVNVTGGSINLTTGNASGNAQGGSLTLTTGVQGVSLNASGGNILLTTANSGNGPLNGGSITLSTGNAAFGNFATGGNLTLTSGTSTSSQTFGGGITLTSGQASGTADTGGSISLTSFTPANGGNITLTGTGASHGIISANKLNLVTPLAIANGGTGTITPALVAGTGIGVSGSWPNQTVALSTPVSIANGGTGTASPSLVAGSNITITGTWPNQTVAQTVAGVTGSGSANTIPLWTSGSVIGNSNLSDFGIGTTGGLGYTQPTSGQLTYFITYLDSSGAQSCHEAFTSHSGSFSSTNLASFPAFSGNLVIVAGWNSSNSQTWTDLLLVGCSTSGNSVTTVSSNASSLGSPGTRTYAMSGTTLQLTYSGTLGGVGVKVTSVN